VLLLSDLFPFHSFFPISKKPTGGARGISIGCILYSGDGTPMKRKDRNGEWIRRMVEKAEPLAFSSLLRKSVAYSIAGGEIQD
jgi:hypothetical protein